MIELSFDNIHKWPRYVKVATLLLCAMVVAMLAYQIFIHDSLQQLQQLERTHFAIKQKINEQKSKLTEAEFDINQLTLESDENNADWLNLISDTISLSGLNLTEINRSEALLKFSALGDYQELTAFLNNLPCCIPIDKLQAKLLSNSILQINMDMMPHSFVENLSMKNNRELGRKFYNPFLLKSEKSGKRESSSWPLAEYSVEQLDLKGSLLRVNEKWGFLTTEDEEIYCVAENDIVGKEEAQIVALDDDSITLDYAVFDVYGRPQHKITTLSLNQRPH